MIHCLEHRESENTNLFEKQRKNVEIRNCLTTDNKHQVLKQYCIRREKNKQR